jgi:hypothetical protein
MRERLYIGLLKGKSPQGTKNLPNKKHFFFFKKKQMKSLATAMGVIASVRENTICAESLENLS